jgi:hypothetical protein
MSFLKKVKISETAVALAVITITTILSYGILIPQLGFYRDDWYMLLAGQSEGAQGIINLFSIDRPLIGYIYALDYAMLGSSVLGWHLYALFLRLLGSIGFFYLLRAIWPDKKFETAIAAMLFAVYPGFLQQPNAATFKNLLLGYDLALFSILATIWAAKANRTWKSIILVVLAVLCAGLYFGIFEAMIGLEGARVLLLWYVLWKKSGAAPKKAILPTLKWSIPYFLLTGAFVFWRVFLFQSERRATNVDVLFSSYGATPLHSLFGIVIETVKDIWEATVLAWFVPFYQFTRAGAYREFGTAIVLAILAVGAVILYIWYAKRQALVRETEAGTGSAEVAWMWLGLPIVAMAVLPIVLSGRNISFEVQWDRYAYHATLGIILAVAGFIFSALRSSARWIVALILIGMSVVTHYFSADYYRDYWSYNRELWWQLSWRAPMLKENTLVFVSMPFGFAEDYEVYGPANMVYYPGEGIKVSAEVLNASTAVLIQQGLTDAGNYNREVYVPKDYSKALIAAFPTTGSCLHVLDGRQVELPGYSGEGLLTDVAHYSQIGQIDTAHSSATIPRQVFGREPEHGWCYYYQRISLARQMGDWQEVAQLADEAQAMDLRPNDYSEWVPALEAYASLGEAKKAKQAAAIIKSDRNIRFFLCRELENGPLFPPPYDHDQILEYLCE